MSDELVSKASPSPKWIHSPAVDLTIGCGGWSLLETGEPVLDGAPRWIRAEIVQRTPIGSSQLVCLRALSSSSDRSGAERNEHASPLVYHDRVYHGLGDASAL